MCSNMLVILTSALSSRLTRYCNWALFFGVARTTRSLNRKKKTYSWLTAQSRNPGFACVNLWVHFLSAERFGEVHKAHFRRCVLRANLTFLLQAFHEQMIKVACRSAGVNATCQSSSYILNNDQLSWLLIHNVTLECVKCKRMLIHFAPARFWKSLSHFLLPCPYPPPPTHHLLLLNSEIGFDSGDNLPTQD